MSAVDVIENQDVVETPVQSEIEICPPLDFEFKKKPFYEFIKRVGDIFCSLLALVLLFLPLLVVAVIIMCVDFGNPFFSQERVGKDGKVFKIYKFRSMYKDAEIRKAELAEQNEVDSSLFKIKDDPRILGKFGKFIRKFSVDELPQLLNILKGDMSVVGPRPFIISEQENFCDERLLVKPGLSCYWQINGKNELSDAMSEYYDKKYIMDRSVLTDIGIVFKTFKVVIFSHNS
ncbi:MAG: sugar transferase [Ruminococcus sp.]|nr:sugar transferase [Ruminococcus sp.]